MRKISVREFHRRSKHILDSVMWKEEVIRLNRGNQIAAVLVPASIYRKLVANWQETHPVEEADE